MAQAILPNVLPTWAPGTVVNAYAELLTDSGQPRPVGPILDSAVVTDNGALVFTSLDLGTAYVAAAQVGGEWHFRYFATQGPENSLEEEVLARQEADAELLASIASKQPLLGYTPENVANRDTDVELVANSDTRYASQRAVKAYVDAVRSLLPVFHVKDPQFGAKVDGVTDDSAAIQAAIDLAFANGGGRVYVPPGTALTKKKLILKAGVILEGAGWVTSIIKLAAGINDHLIEGANYATEGIWDSGTQSICIDGNRAENVAGAGVRVAGQCMIFRDTVVRNCAGDGINLHLGIENHQKVSGEDSFFDHVRTISCAGKGVAVDAKDTTLRDVQTIQCSEYGFYLAANCVIVQCHSWCYTSDATCTKVGMYLAGDVSAVNCVAEGASEAQVQLAGSNNRWQGGDIYDSTGKPNVPLIEFMKGENWGTHVIEGAYLHNFGESVALKFTGDGANSRINCHIYDPGVEKLAASGEPAKSIIWDVTLGGTTKRGTIPGYHLQRRRTFAPFSGDIPNYTLYVNEEGLLRWKDGAGVTKTVQVA